MLTRISPWTAILTLSLVAACKADDPITTDSADDSTGQPITTTTNTPTTGETAETGATGETGETGAPPMDCSAIMLPVIDESACGPLATDYQPRDNPDGDMWEACAGDMYPYVQVNPGTPGSAARIEAYIEMAKLLWDNPDEPTPEDFTAARDQYVIPEGLESRLNRREDLHVEGIPMDEWDPQVDGDKQCTVQALADKYPARCVGPITLKPIIEAAFAAGQSGEGDPRIHAAEIRAAIDWFLWLSVYKEAETCGSENPGDCDSCWAYYTGLEPMDSGKAFSRDVLDQSQNTHERIWDGIRAVRCWRDLYNEGGTYPLFADLDTAARDEFEVGWEQLDQALHRGVALVVRGHAEDYFNALCGTGDAYQPAAWTYLQIIGPALQREAEARDAGQAATLAALWANSEPTAQDIADGIAAIDAIFACP